MASAVSFGISSAKREILTSAEASASGLPLMHHYRPRIRASG